MDDKDDIDDVTRYSTDYIYIGPKFLVDLKLRFAKWLDERRRQ